MYAFASRRTHFTEILDSADYKAKVAHIKPTRFVSKLPDIERLVDVLRKSQG
jgi:hypothetical protein